MMRVHHDIEGRARLVRRLRNIEPQAKRCILEVLREEGETLAGQARERVRVQREPDRPDPSRLAQSITSSAEDMVVTVQASAPYAVFVELGTSKMPAEPFLQPAFDETVQRLSRRLTAKRGDS